MPCDDQFYVLGVLKKFVIWLISINKNPFY
jgi:hypothetical protein